MAYQLVGTNFVTKRAQRALASELQQSWAVQVEEDAQLGDAVARIQIPSLNVDSVVVKGVGVEDLKKGPGHFPGSAQPGELGNMVVMGHRTTYGAPFYRLDELKPGDPIVVIGRDGPRRYLVKDSRVVSPREVDVVARSSDARLTLATCHPRYSAAKRLIISAELEGPTDGVQETEPDLEVLPDLV